MGVAIWDGMHLLKLLRDENQHTGRRLRVRKNDLSMTEIHSAIMCAINDGYGGSGSHGGTVNNSYGYPAETEWTAVAAIRIEGSDQRGVIGLRVGAGRMGANKATQAGAMRHLMGGFGAWWRMVGWGTVGDLETPTQYRIGFDRLSGPLRMWDMARPEMSESADKRYDVEITDATAIVPTVTDIELAEVGA